VSLPLASVNPVERVVVSAEGLWAQRHVVLDPEPPGDRCGIAGGDLGGEAPESAEAPRLVTVGDSLVAGCGVESQSEALTPRIARRLAEESGGPVRWEARGRLGATMRRVRYRLLPEVTGDVDLLFLCAGSNDIMAGRARQDWIEDLTAVLDRAVAVAARVVLCSSGQPYRSPALPPTLRRDLRRRIDVQTEDSLRLCEERGVGYVDVAHADLIPGFWAGDRFHPSGAGYEYAASMIVDAMVARERAA